ncbi:MAG: hypothetical protein Q9185_003977 [Variospora sp. 1 TL-2023]
MATSTRDRYEQQPEARISKNIHPQQAESRRAYDLLESGHPPKNPRVSAVAPDDPDYDTDMPPSGIGDYNEDRRLHSPVRSPVDRRPLNNSLTKDMGRQSYGLYDHDVDHYRSYPRPQREDRGRPDSRIHSRPGSISQTFLKRSAPSSDSIVEHEYAAKRRRQIATEANRSINNGTAHSSSTDPRPLADMAGGKIHSQANRRETLVPALRIVYVHASTQTQKTQIQSSRLELLQEEELIAHTKHTSEMRRKKEALDLELEHERRMLELRHRFEMPTVVPSGRLDQAGLTVSNAPSAETPGLLQSQSHASKEIAEQNGMSLVKEEEQLEAQPANAGRELRIMGASRHSSISRHESRESGMIDEAQSTAADASSILDRLMGSPPIPDHQDRTNTAQKPRKYPERPANENTVRTGSRTPTTVHVKTSPPPAFAQPSRGRPEKPRWPDVTHLTCYFWKNGKCTKPAHKCLYAHYETGSVAMAPDSLRKMKQNGSYFRQGAW